MSNVRSTTAHRGFGTDNGPKCQHCAGTIYSYTIDEHYLETEEILCDAEARCAGCHAIFEFSFDGRRTIMDGIGIRRAHEFEAKRVSK